MWQNAGDTYVEERVLSADPVELVILMYQACTAEVREARRYLRDGQIAERSRSISKASSILAELNGSLDHQRGGNISRQLARLYEYLQYRLLEANFHQSDAPLAEVLGLLATLLEGWTGAKRTETAKESRAMAEAWTQSGYGRELPEASRAWSL